MNLLLKSEELYYSVLNIEKEINSLITSNRKYLEEISEDIPRFGEVININSKAGPSNSPTSNNSNRCLKPPHWYLSEDSLNELENHSIPTDIECKLRIFNTFLSVNINDVVLVEYIRSDIDLDLDLYILIKSVETRFGEVYLLGSNLDYSQDIVFNLKNIKKILSPIDKHLEIIDHSLIKIKFSGNNPLKRKREE